MDYNSRIRNRSVFRFYIGIIPRFINYIKFSFYRFIAIHRGASIGKFVILPRKLAFHANKNLSVGDYTSVGSYDIDLRGKVTIGNNVIINSGVSILTASHNHNSPYFETTYSQLIVKDYAWLATGCTILPNVGQIGYGAICGAKAVVAKSVADMEIVVGNPCRVIGKRLCVHDKLAVESLRGFDLIRYFGAFKTKC